VVHELLYIINMNGYFFFFFCIEHEEARDGEIDDKEGEEDNNYEKEMGDGERHNE